MKGRSQSQANHESLQTIRKGDRMNESTNINMQAVGDKKTRFLNNEGTGIALNSKISNKYQQLQALIKNDTLTYESRD